MSIRFLTSLVTCVLVGMVGCSQVAPTADDRVSPDVSVATRTTQLASTSVEPSSEVTAEDQSQTVRPTFVHDERVQLVQHCGPPQGYQRPCPIKGVDQGDYNCGPELRWSAARPIPFEVFAQGEYVGPHRTAHTSEYRLRVDDQVGFIYRLARTVSGKPYELNVGDTIQLESLSDENLDRQMIVQPDGTVTLSLLGQVRAAGRSMQELQDDIEERYKQYYKKPAITISPLIINTKLEDLRAAVDNRAGVGGQSLTVRVSPDGTVQLPAIGSVCAQGLTLDELKYEIDERYSQLVQGIEVTPILSNRAPRFIYVLGEVQNEGRFTLQGPTSVMQGIALAGGWNVGGNLRQIIIFRRGADWRLQATKIDLRGALYGRRPTPADELWLRDSDILLVPKSPILQADDAIELLFTRGLYGVIPFNMGIGFQKLSTI